MKAWIIGLISTGLVLSLQAAPLRVAVLEFTDATGTAPDRLLGGSIPSQTLAERGVFLLGKNLLDDAGFQLIDRRDFINQIDRMAPPSDLATDRPQASFLRAAQMLNADVVLRGTLLSFSSTRSSVNMEGHSANFDDLTIRVGLEALDTRDGTLIAVEDGAATERFRQTPNVQTSLGEDDLVSLMNRAVSQAIPGIRDRLEARAQSLQDRPRVRLSVTTTADPALVEIDGVLVGTTPLENFEVYRGDHVITIGKPGYRDISQRVLFDQDTRLEVPMLKTELDADQIKEILLQSRLNIYSGIEPTILIERIQER